MTNAVPKKYYFDLTTARSGKLITVRGKIVRVTNASDAAATIGVAVHENIPDRYEIMSKTGKVKDDNGFESVYISNDAQPGKWVEILISEGAYDVEVPVISSIDSIINPVPIDDSTPISVDDSGLQSLLSDLINLLENDQDKRTALTTLAGASFAHVNNATTVVVSSGTNVNGVIIRTLHIDGAGYVSHVKIGANYLYRSHSTNIGGVFLQDIFVPAGLAIELSTTGGGAYISMAYEVL